MNTKLLFLSESQSDILNFCRSFRYEYNIVGVTLDGDEAIKMIDKFKPEIVVLGLIVKGASGFEVLEHIKSNELNCKIVVFSALLNHNVISKCMEYGATYYISRTIEMDILKDRVKHLFDED